MKTKFTKVLILTIVLIIASLPINVNASGSIAEEEIVIKNTKGDELIAPMTIVSTSATKVRYIPIGQSIPTTTFASKWIGDIYYSGQIPLKSVQQVGNQYMCIYEGTIYGSL